MGHGHLMAVVVLVAVAISFGCEPKPKPVTKPPVTQKVTPQGPPKLTFIDSRLVEAKVALNGNLIGTIAELMKKGGVEIKKGIHRIEVSHPGYRPFRVELSVGEMGERLTVQLNKRKLPPPQ